MSPEAVVAIASLTSVLSAFVFWLAYRDYLNEHRAFVAAVREMHQSGPVTADTVAALSPLPPLASRSARRTKLAA